MNDATATIHSATLLDAKISLFSDVRSPRPERHMSVGDFLAHVQNGFWATPVANVRYGGGDAAKKKLPAVKPSGTFSTSRADGLIRHSGVLCLDFDHVGTGLEDLKNRLREDSHVLAFFLSPSGTGLKVFVPVRAANADEHRRCWEAAAHHFAQIPDGGKLDALPKNVSANCFVSYDPNAWVANGERVSFLPCVTSSPRPPGNTISEESEHSISHAASNAQIRHSAEQRLAALPLVLRGTYARYLETRAVQPGKRHHLLRMVIPPLYTVLSPSLMVQLLMLHYDLHCGIWRTPRESHRAEIEEMLARWPDVYLQSLPKEARAYYDSLPSDNTRCAFRICRDMARRNGLFYLSAGHLGGRLGLHPQKAYRILKGFEADSIIAPIKMGGIWAAGHSKMATLWKWVLLGPAIPGESTKLAA